MKMLSIIIPVYNLEDYIEDTVRLCEEQDLDKREYEIICIDDGSSDKSLDVLNSLCSEYPNIVVYSQENGGVSKARNKGLELAQGKYIWFVDGDDLPSCNILGKCIDFVEKNNVDIFSFKIKSTTERLPYDTQWKEMITCPDGECIYDFMTVAGGVGGGVCCQWYRREVIIDNNIRFNENIKYSEDVLFSFVVLMHCTHCAKTESVLYAYYQREGSAMHSNNHIKHLESMYLLAKEYERLGKEKKNTTWYNILKSKQHFAVKAMLFSLVQEGNVKLAREKIKILKQEGLYPYPFLVESLKNNQTKKQALINYASFLFPMKWYFILMVRISSFRKK